MKIAPFWKSKTTWLAVATTLFHAVGQLTGHAGVAPTLQTVLVTVLGAFLRDTLRVHGNLLSDVLAAAGVGLPVGADGGEADSQTKPGA